MKEDEVKKMHKLHRFVAFSKKFKKLTLVCLLFSSLIVLFHLNKELAYESLELAEFYYNKLAHSELNYHSKQINSAGEARIFCIILTQVDNLRTKARVVSQTWARECDAHRFITVLSTNNRTYERIDAIHHGLSILKPQGLVNDTYSQLTDKVYLTLMDVYENYGGFDFYLKADDDTYVFMDNLRSYLKSKSPSQMTYYGHKFYSLTSYHSGGGGYVLPREVLSLLANRLRKKYALCPNTGIEDMDMGKGLRELNIFPEHALDQAGYKLFHPFDVEFYYKDSWEAYWVSFIYRF